MKRGIVVLVNPQAGWGRAGRMAEPVADRLREAGLCVRTQAGRDPDETADLARSAVTDGTDGLVVLGGDGMMHLALQAVAGTPTPLGVVPFGSGNDLASACGIPCRDPLAAVDLVVADQVRTLDLGRAGATWFATVLTVGFAAAVAERVQKIRQPLGDLRYPIGVLTGLRSWRTARYLLELDGERSTTDAIVLAIGNTASFGGGVRICEGADPADGIFDVTQVGDPGLTDLVRLFPKLFGGRAFTHPSVTRHRARTVGLAAAGQIAYADGERVGPLPLTVECVPAALRLFAPNEPGRPRSG